MKNSLLKISVPDRFKGRTGYQIFPDRYYRGGAKPQTVPGRILKEWNDSVPSWEPDEDGEYRNLTYYGGDLKGIALHADEIAKMNFDLVYVGPISQTLSSHHYDVENQKIIDPWMGTSQNVAEVCDEFHKRGILVCADLVFNHMGAHSMFFQEALQDPHSPYREWFEWENGQPVYWYGFKDMPQCNKLNPAYQRYVYEVIEFYLKLGVDGIRLDLGENLPEELLWGIQKTVKEINPEALIVVEMWELATKKENPQIFDGQTDSTMNYPLADAILRWVRYGNVGHFYYTQSELAWYPKQVQDVLWNFLDSHDTPRALTMLAGRGMLENPFDGRIWDIEDPWRYPNWFDTYNFRKWEAEHEDLNMDLARERLQIASLIQYVSKGNPVVFAGTEVGLIGYKDPFNRKPYPWENQDLILKEHYTKLGAMRKEAHLILKDGEENVEVTPKIMTVIRRSDYGTLYTTINRTDQPVRNPMQDRRFSARELFTLQNSNQNVLMPYGAVCMIT